MVDSTADLFDVHPDLVSIPEIQWLRAGGRVRFGGPIATIKLFEDNSLIRAAFSEPGEGRVLVVDGGGSMRRALIGDKLVARALENGWVGAVVNGCIRDRAAIDRMPFGLRCLGTHPAKTEKRGEGQRDVELSFGACGFSPGHWLYADEDGVLLAPHSLG